MIEGPGADPEAVYAYYALHKLHILPSSFATLPPEEKAFIMAAIDVKIESERRAEKRAQKRR